MHTIRDAVYGSLQQVSNYSPVISIFVNAVYGSLQQVSNYSPVISIFVNRFLDTSLLSEPFHVAYSNMLLNDVTVMSSDYEKAYNTVFP